MVLNPRFYIVRLRNGSLPELFFRVRQSLALYHLKRSAKGGRGSLHAPPIDKRTIENLRMPDLTYENQDGSRHEAPVLDSSIRLGLHLYEVEAARTDIRMRWEPARLQQATAILAYARRLSASPAGARAKATAKKIVLAWLDSNSFLQGEDYLSAMECALRLPVFFYALKCLDTLTVREYDHLAEAIYHHGLLISKRLSRYSSLGNHTVAEAVGLVFAGAVYRQTRQGRGWLQTGIELLTDELPHQILEDGGPAEQSLNYHRFVLDLYWLAVDFLQKNGLADSDGWRSRLSRGEFFLDAFKDQCGHWPAIGDSDDGFAVAPGLLPARGGGQSPLQRRTVFEHSGYTLVRQSGIVFTFDHGSLGMPPLFNHGHADALSVTLSCNGKPLLVDPGTYRYNGVPSWRRYFRGTSAHNTVIIDGRDQAFQETGFVWSKPYRAGLMTVNEIGGHRLCVAEHDGYTRLKHPVRHRRSVLFADQADFLIKDRFDGTGEHVFQLNFHLHPRATVSRQGRWWVVDHGGERIFLHLQEGDFELVYGQEKPTLGWFSSRYGDKEPTCTLTFSRAGDAADMVFTTVICTRISSGLAEDIAHEVGELERQTENP